MLLAAPAVKMVGPVTVRLPLSVIAPLVVTLKAPLMVEAARSKAFTSLSVTVLPLTTLTVLKSLALFKRDVIGGPRRQDGRAGDGEIAAIGNRAIGGDGERAAHGGGAEIQGIHIVER